MGKFYVIDQVDNFLAEKSNLRRCRSHSKNPIIRCRPKNTILNGSKINLSCAFFHYQTDRESIAIEAFFSL